jgi:hypothetical protein
MAGKQKAKIKGKGVQAPMDEWEAMQPLTPEEETVIETPRGAVAVAIRYAETADSARLLITIRAGYGAKDIKFDFGNYGSGPVKGGGDGSEPPCP